MSEKGTIAIRGSSLGRVFALISVSCPEGCICTAANGTKTLEAENTSGSALFAIPEPETLPEIWTVTITDAADPTRTKSRSVEISEKYQLSEITLRFELELVTTANGLDAAYTPNGVILTPAIDVTDYKTMRIEAARTYTANSTYSIWFGLKPEAGGSVTAKKVVKSGTRQFYDLDISSLTGKYYFASEAEMSRSGTTLLANYGGSVKVTVYSALFTEEVLE